MKQRLKADPTIVYEYGARPPRLHLERVLEQLRLAHRYRNALCEIELRRRCAAAAIVHVEELEAARAEIETMDRRVKEICAERRRRNAAGRRKLPFTEQEKSELERIKPALKELRGRYKTQKAAAYGSEANKAALKAIDAGSNEEHKQARRVASEEWGLYWGTYLLIEEAAKKFRKGSPPKFRGFRGEGSLAVQIHSTPDSRFTTERLQSEGGNTVFSLCAGFGRRATLELCIGGEDPRLRISGKNPACHAVLDFTLHRPLPESAAISWVRLRRRKIGTNFKWFVQFVLARKSGWRKPCGHRAAAIDDRHEEMADGTMRICRWEGEDGDSGELRLPADWMSAMKHVASLQSLHDEKTNVAKGQLLAWVKARVDEREQAGATKESAFPEWWNETAKTLPAWRGAARFAGLVLKWRDNRFAGDEEMFAAMEAYRLKAKHLWNWACHEKAKAIRRRTDMYRAFARALARKYGTIAVRRRSAPPALSELDRFAAVSDFRGRIRQGGLSLTEIVVAAGGDDSTSEILRAWRCCNAPPVALAACAARTYDEP